jgi:hypothetical protein
MLWSWSTTAFIPSGNLVASATRVPFALRDLAQQSSILTYIFETSCDIEFVGFHRGSCCDNVAGVDVAAVVVPRVVPTKLGMLQR